MKSFSKLPYQEIEPKLKGRLQAVRKALEKVVDRSICNPKKKMVDQ